MKSLYKGAGILLLIFTITLAANSQTITGKITDQDGNEIPGVSVYLKGTTIGTISDVFGDYTLIIRAEDAIGETDTIVYSFIGFSKQEFSVPADPDATYTHNVVLLEEAELMKELVVVGYGVQRKSDITGAISTIKTQDIVNLPVVSVDQALQGKAAGVQVSQTSGAPGEQIKVRIRGLGTINNNDPLYIIDGVPTKNVTDIINPEDIESMTVLKDAASAAIYGSRAGNGVIIIKTKKGTAGKTRFNFNSYVGMQTHGKLTPMCNTQEYVSIYNEAAANDEREPIPDDIIPQLSNTNWMEEIFRPAMMQNYQLTVSGGDAKSSFLIGGGYLKQEGIILNSDYSRINFRTAVSTMAADWVKVGTNLNFSYSNKDIIGASGDGYGGNGGSVIRYGYFRAPPVPVYEPSGAYSDLPMFEGYPRASLNTWFGDGYNPVGLANKYDWTADIYRLFGNFFAEFKIIEGLDFRTDFGVDLPITAEKRFNENWGTDGRINSPNNMTSGVKNSFTWNWTNTLTYQKTFSEKHYTTFLGGVEAIKNSFHEQIGTDQDFPDQSAYLRYLGNGLTLYKGANELASSWSLFSVFARVNYNYDNKIILEGVIRADGSSRFSEENRWGLFYSGSAGWNMHNMSFMQNVSWISQLKPRVSIGQTGNQEIGLYNYLSLIGSDYNYPIGGTANFGSAVNSFGNINTTWETTTMYDIGLDMAFLDNRLTVVTDYYWRYTTDMLIPVPLPPSGGTADPPFINAGEVLNRGFEFELFWREKKTNFEYEIGGNFATLFNKVLELSGGRPIAAGRIDNGVFATLTEEGYPIGSFYLYEMEGIFQNEFDIFTHAYQGPNIAPGDVKFKDQNGDGKIDEKDRTHVGSPIPKFTYGLTGNFSYKGFELSLFFQGVYGNEYYMQVNHDIEGFYRGFNVTKRLYDNHWTGDGSTDEYPRVSWKGASNNKIASTRFMEPASYFRMRNLTFGYSFKMKETSALTSVRLYFSAQNLFTITKYPGLDPEMYDSNNLNSETVKNVDLAAGIDWGTYPTPKIYTLGINLIF